MNTLAIDHPASSTAVVTAMNVGPSRQPFSDLLKVADYATERTSDGAEKVVRDAVEQLVSTTFVQPILSNLRNDPFKSYLFHGGLAEDMFGSQLDTLMSERITHASRFPIVDAIYDNFMKAVNSRKVDANDANRNLDIQA